MVNKKSDLWNRLPGSNLDKKSLTKRMRKVEGATLRHAHKFLIKRWDNVRDVQRNVIFWILALGVLIAATGFQLSWNQQSYQTTAPARDGTYAEAVLGSVDTLNPLFAKTSAEQSASYLMFSRILNYDKTGHLNYDLATNISINENNTVYTVSIKPDIMWHDGARLTAEDIAFTVDLMKNPDTRSVFSGWEDITARAIDDYTIQFTLKSTFAAFENALIFPILPKHVLSKVLPSNLRENNFSQNPIGSGSFKFNLLQDVDINSGRKVIYMSRNNSYYNGIANLARFQLHTYGTEDAIVKALSKNEVSSATDLSPANIGRINKKLYNIATEPIQNGVYAIINTQSKLLQDVNLRRALKVATDTSAIRDKLPTGTPALWLPFTTGQLTGNDIPSAPKFNLKYANKILDNRGWKLNSHDVRTKKGKELKITVVTIKNTELEHVLDILTDQWRKLGFTIETKVIDLKDATQGDVQSILQPRNFDVLLYHLDIGADPDVYAYWHSSQATLQGLNFSNYNNAISDVALSSARSVIDPELRNVKYITFAKQWLSDVPAIGLYQSTIQYVSSKRAHSFNASDVLISPVDRYSDILDWSVGNRDVYKTP